MLIKTEKNCKYYHKCSNNFAADYTCEKENDVQKELHKFQHICETVSKTLKRRTQKEIQFKLYNVMATPILLYGSETWNLRDQDLSRIEASETTHLRWIRGCTIVDKIRNEDIRNKLEIFNLCETMHAYCKKLERPCLTNSADNIPQNCPWLRPERRKRPRVFGNAVDWPVKP